VKKYSQKTNEDFLYNYHYLDSLDFQSLIYIASAIKYRTIKGEQNDLKNKIGDYTKIIRCYQAAKEKTNFQTDKDLLDEKLFEILIQRANNSYALGKETNNFRDYAFCIRDCVFIKKLKLQHENLSQIDENHKDLFQNSTIGIEMLLKKTSPKTTLKRKSKINDEGIPEKVNFEKQTKRIKLNIRNIRNHFNHDSNEQILGEQTQNSIITYLNHIDLLLNTIPISKLATINEESEDSHQEHEDSLRKSSITSLKLSKNQKIK